MSCEACIEVEFTYDVDPGYAGDRIDPPYPASVDEVRVSIIGPHRQRLECPDWLADILVDQVTEEELLGAAQGARDDAAYDAWADRRDMDAVVRRAVDDWTPSPRFGGIRDYPAFDDHDLRLVDYVLIGLASLALASVMYLFFVVALAIL
jgi:hypothetical protein